MDNLDKAFEELGKLTAPKKELLSGELGDEILNDILGKKPKVKKPRTIKIVKPHGQTKP